MYFKLEKSDKNDYVFVSTSTPGFRGGLAWIKYAKKLRRLKLQGQNLSKSASLRHSEKIVFMGDPKTQQQKVKQKSINWTIFIYFQENRRPGKLFISLKMHYFFGKP